MALTSPSIYTIGIDPGWKNLGAALMRVPLTKEGKPDSANAKLVKAQTYNPSECKNYSSFFETLESSLGITNDMLLGHVTIERYVAFNNVFTAETEMINRLIGALGYYFEEYNIEPVYTRSIDWKMSLSKYLFKARNFRNPSDSLDKVFSIAAAKECAGMQESKEAITTHEADAICLGFLPFVPSKA